MRLIDADAWLKHKFPSDRESSEFARGWDTAVYAIAFMSPTIDAAPVVRGRWIAEQKNAEYCEFRCSECGESAGETDQFDETELKQFSEWYEFCPRCGTKMEESQ